MKLTLQFAIVCYCALGSASTSPRIESVLKGTVAIVDVMENEVVFAADSRGTKGDGSQVNDDCKLATFKDDAIFVSSGWRKMAYYDNAGKEHRLDSHVVAARAISLGRIKHGKDALASFAANYWAHEERHYFQSAVDVIPGAFPPGKEIVDGAFASRDETGKLSVYVIKVAPTVQRGKNIVVAPVQLRSVNKTAVFGYPVIVQEFVKGGISERARTAITKWENTLPFAISPQDRDEQFDIQLIQWTIDLSHQPMIGGDVNAVVLDRTGIRWPAQKEYCRGQQ
jgi:hypothetical protein